MNKNAKQIPTQKSHDEMVAEWMKDPAFKAEYDALDEEYQEMPGVQKNTGLERKNIASLKD